MPRFDQPESVEWIHAPCVPLLRIRPGRQEACYLIGPVVSYYMHWDGEAKRTQPCLLYQCGQCARGLQKRPLSYVGGATFRRIKDAWAWAPAVVEVPWTTGVTLSQMIGQVVALRRDRNFGPVNVGKYLFEQPTPDVERFPVVEHLMRMWRLPNNVALSLVGNLGPQLD